MRRLFIIVGICSSLLSCRAEADFASDLQSIAVWLGLAESGGCAEVRNTGPFYQAQLWGFPSRLCSTEQRSGNSYSEYLEIARKELQLMGPAAERYRTASCTDEVDTFQGFPSDPLLTTAQNAGITVTSSANYPASQWLTVTDIIYEGQGFLMDSWGMSSAAIAGSRATTYGEYISISAGMYVYYLALLNADSVCSTEAIDLVTSYHPGWLAYQLGDSTQLTRRVINGRCEYGSAPSNPVWACSTLGP